jgi:hypothetical protein
MTEKAKGLTSSILQMRDKLRRSVSGWSIQQCAFKPASNAWSATEILEHLYRTEFVVMNTIWRIKEDGKKGSVQPQLVHSNQGRTVQEIVQPHEAKCYEAPSAVVPTMGGSMAFWLAALESNQRIVEILASILDDVDLVTIAFSHFVVGPMNAEQWFSYVPWHMERHIRQIERLRETEGFPQCEDLHRRRSQFPVDSLAM